MVLPWHYTVGDQVWCRGSQIGPGYPSNEETSDATESEAAGSNDNGLSHTIALDVHENVHHDTIQAP